MIVAINKIDRKDARIDEVLDEIYDLFIDLDANEDQLDFPLLYVVGRDGVASLKLEDKSENLLPLFEVIVNEVPGPRYDPEAPFQMLVCDLGYNDYLGRLAIGKVVGGTARSRDNLVCIGEGDVRKTLKISSLQVYEGMKFSQVDSVSPGDLVVLAGIEDVRIGDTISTTNNPKPLKRITVEEPTVSMRFGINTSPFSGREGKFVQSNRIRDRLQRETLQNVAIKVDESEDRDSFVVKGRGEFQLAILIETMRREGFELSVGRPEVIMKHENGEVLEPIEHFFVDCEEGFLGVVTEKLSVRKGKMINMVNHGSGRVQLEFSVPSRSLIGYRDEFLTDTRGTGIMNSYFSGYEKHRGEFPSRFTGSIVADRQGRATPYALYNIEPRGSLFIAPDTQVYEGMIIGEHNREDDINVNATKEKKLSNMRSANKDESVILAPMVPITLERSLYFIRDDELVEVTPQSIRLRKKQLSAQKRSVIRSVKFKESGK